MASSPAAVSALIDLYITPNTKGAITEPLLNALLQAIVALNATGGSGPSVAAYLIAMNNAQAGAAALVRDKMPPEPGDPLNILFEHLPYVTQGGQLEQFFAQVTGLNMAIIRPAAEMIPV